MINTVWQQLRISQEYLAILPGVQRTLLENAEKSLLYLPATELRKLLHLPHNLTLLP